MRPSYLLRVALKPIFILQILFSLYFLLRGHNAPGGGFIGGLLAAASFALAALAFDVEKARSFLPLSPQALMAWGLVTAMSSGFLGIFHKEPYMTGVWRGEIPLPAVGSLKLGTPLFFDIGVYLTVLGMTTLVVFALFERGGPQEDSPWRW